MPGRLYVVSTPIGNLDDITFRAVEVLKTAGLIAAEDTRRTAKLLRHFGINTKTTSLHEHNEQQKLTSLVDTLCQGVDVALVSDAGTPLVADPGQRLVSAAIAAGIQVVPIPGPSAALAALAVSGFSADEFVFCGFAPSKSSDRIAWVQAIDHERRPVIFYEAPHRIKAMLETISSILVTRPIVVARELTKLHEEILRGTAATIREHSFIEKGEFTVIVGPKTEITSKPLPNTMEVAAYFDQTANKITFSRRAAIAKTAEHFGLSTNQVYEMLERFKHSPPS